MERVSKEQVQRAFERLAVALGKPFDPMTPAWTSRADGTNKSTVGVWMLDNGYGGYTIEEIGNEAGGISHPLGSTRRTARDFVESVQLVLAALRLADENGVGKRLLAYQTSEYYLNGWGKSDDKRYARIRAGV